MSRKTLRSRPAGTRTRTWPRAASPGQPPAPRRRPQTAAIIATPSASLLDVVDNLLNRGVVLNAEITLALANVDLVYVRLSALLCAADRVGTVHGDR